MLESDDRKWCDAWNFGPLEAEVISVRQLVEKFCKAWGSGSWKDCSNAKSFREANILRLNIDKATRELGWRPRWRLDQAVERTARWYRNFYNGATSMRKVCEDDIVAYEEAPLPGKPLRRYSGMGD
jgi:CDP-glucose 4,6-dehydratase